MSVRRMMPFVLVNIIVSSAVVLALLTWWDSRRPDPVDIPLPTPLVAIAPSPTLLGQTAAEAAPEATEPPAAPAAPSQLTHVVQPGETLGTISDQYGIGMQAIVDANDLQDPNLLAAGQTLFIPIEVTAAPTEGPPPTIDLADVGQGGEVRIELSEVGGAGTPEGEFITIANLGARPANLQSWVLADEDGHEYTFGHVTIFGDGAAIQLHTGSGADNPTDLYWGLNEAVWQPGETATLRDAEGTTQATFVVP